MSYYYFVYSLILNYIVFNPVNFVLIVLISDK
jgi:hypothetical protein